MLIAAGPLSLKTYLFHHWYNQNVIIFGAIPASCAIFCSFKFTANQPI